MQYLYLFSFPCIEGTDFKRGVCLVWAHMELTILLKYGLTKSMELVPYIARCPFLIPHSAGLSGTQHSTFT